MSLSDNIRLQFHQWLLANELESEVADAILASMPPDDWHELATKTDLAALRAEVVTKAELAELRSEVATKADAAEMRAEFATTRSDLRAGMAAGFSDVTQEIRDLRKLMYTVILGMVGFMLSVVLSVLAAAIAVGVV